MGIVFSFLTVREQFNLSLVNKTLQQGSLMSEFAKLSTIFRNANGLSDSSKKWLEKLVPKLYTIVLRIGYAGFRENKEFYPIQSNLNANEFLDAYDKGSKILGFRLNEVHLNPDGKEKSYSLNNKYLKMLRKHGINGEPGSCSSTYIPVFLDIVKLGNKNFKWNGYGNTFNMGFHHRLDRNNPVGKRIRYPIYQSGFVTRKKKDKRHTRPKTYKPTILHEEENAFSTIGIGGVLIVSDDY